MSGLAPFVTQNFLEDMGLVLCVAALTAVICQFLRLLPSSRSLRWLVSATRWGS